MVIGEISKKPVYNWRGTTYKWKIDEINQRIIDIENGLSFVSNAFSLNGKSEAKFVMKLEHNDDDDRDDADIRLVCTDFGQSQEIQLDAKSWFEDSEGKIEGIEEDVFKLDREDDSALLTYYNMDTLKAFAKDDSVFVCIEVQHEAPSNQMNESGPVYDENELTDRSEFGRNMLELHSGGHYDLTIQVGNKEFKVSKLILMSYSEVFRRMLSCSNSTEAQSGIIKIDDIKPAVIGAMIKWIYQADISNMKKVAGDLYQAAEKYDIALLKKKCVNVMGANLSKKNFPFRLILAYKFNEEHLKKRIIDFLQRSIGNLKSLMESDEWIEFASDDSELAKKIVSDIFG